MKFEIAFIRHGQTDMSRLVGVTDFPLSGEAKKKIEEKNRKGVYPAATLVYSSGLSRCLETARLIYDNVPIIVLNEIRAMDYGDFDGVSYEELEKNRGFKDWETSGPMSACPNGEQPYSLITRSVSAFRKICEETAGNGLEKIAIITHRTVMQAILQRYLLPRSDYADYSADSGGGYIVEYDTVFSSGKIISRF